MNILPQIIRYIKKHLFLCVIVLFTLLLYIYYFRSGTIVLGGEGEYWLDFRVYFKNLGNTWLNLGNGLVATSLSSIFIYPLFFSFFHNIPIQSFLIVCSIYLL